MELLLHTEARRSGAGCLRPNIMLWQMHLPSSVSWAISWASLTPATSTERSTFASFALAEPAGHSRPFFRRIRDRMAVGAIGPEARVDPRGFARSIERAETRLAEMEQQWKEASP